MVSPFGLCQLVQTACCLVSCFFLAGYGLKSVYIYYGAGDGGTEVDGALALQEELESGRFWEPDSVFILCGGAVTGLLFALAICTSKLVDKGGELLSSLLWLLFRRVFCFCWICCGVGGAAYQQTEYDSDELAAAEMGYTKPSSSSSLLSDSET